MASVVIIGASERNIPWTEWLMTSLAAYRWPGNVELVNPRYEEMFGQRCYPSVEELPEAPMLGVIAIGAAHVAEQVERLAALGCREVVVISNGFGELGTAEGLAREAELRAVCAACNVRLIGPNCVGFASFRESLCAIAQPTPRNLAIGVVSLVSQSGGLTGAALGAFQRLGVGVDVAYSIGNGTVFSLADALRAALERETTKIVCGVVESIGSAEHVQPVVDLARETGKELVFLLLGQSAGGRGVAQSHTGMVVGEQRIVGTWLRHRGIQLVGSPDELAECAQLLSRLGPEARARRPFIATVSGGGAGLASDLAARQHAELAHLTPATSERLRPLLPEGAYIGNPLDIATGDVPGAYAALIEDPNVGYLIEPWNLPWPDTSPDFRHQRAALERVVDFGARAGIPVIIGSLFEQPLSEWARDLGRRPGVCVSTNLERTFAALACLQGGEGQSVTQGPPPAPVGGAARPASPGRLVAEVEARVILEQAGLPVVRGGQAVDPSAAAALAATLRAPWVVKVAVPSVAHKERVGGVRLGLASPAEVQAACEEIAKNAAEAGVSGLEKMSFLVTEMAYGPELLLGAIRDPLAGPSLSVAVGGWAAETGALFGTLVLPAEVREIHGLLEKAKLPYLLGRRRADELAGCLITLGREFATGSLAEYQTVEINPLILSASGPVLVDALLVG